MQTVVINQIFYSIIQMLLLNSFLIVGIQSLTHEGHLLSDFAAWVNKRPARGLFKPLCLCMRCMSSVWGCIFFAQTHSFFIPSLGMITVVPYCLLLVGTMTIIDYLFTYLNR